MGNRFTMTEYAQIGRLALALDTYSQHNQIPRGDLFIAVQGAVQHMFLATAKPRREPRQFHLDHFQRPRTRGSRFCRGSIAPQIEA